MENVRIAVSADCLTEFVFSNAACNRPATSAATAVSICSRLSKYRYSALGATFNAAATDRQDMPRSPDRARIATAAAMIAGRFVFDGYGMMYTVHFRNGLHNTGAWPRVSWRADIYKRVARWVGMPAKQVNEVSDHSVRVGLHGICYRS